MAKNKLKEDTVFTSNEKPKSAILNSSFVQRLNSLFGFRTTNDKVDDEFETKYGIKFVRVDLNNTAYRVRNAALGSVFQSQHLNQNVERLFNAYLDDTTMGYDDILDRQKRLNELYYAYCNDPFIASVCKLVADEATQIDAQDRLITISSPNASFVNRTYELFNLWGITQQRVHSACFWIELYGETFWAQKVGINGIEKIKPLFANQIKERLEFSPTNMAKFLAQRDGWSDSDKSRSSKIQDLVELIKGKDSFDVAENFADMFDDKLLGYELEGNMIVPPWVITHFRFDADSSEFYPYGRPPLLAALAPFKMAMSTTALQALARTMSFPITLYKVKTSEGMPAAQVFNVVNEVRANYDNLGVNPATTGSEVYTVNTKIWLPDSMLDVEVKDAKCDIDFIGDLENYQNRVAIASGVPKGYIDPTTDPFGESGVALVEQYKPFARHIYAIQTTFLEGLGELIRLQYAITGEFDYNTPFVLSMRYPAQEVSSDKRDAYSGSLELAQKVIETIQKALGLEDGEPLPEDVVTDILSKYSFINPTDIQKWLKLTSFKKSVVKSDDSGDSGGGDSSSDMESSDSSDSGSDASSSSVEESLQIYRNSLRKLNEAQKIRLNEVKEKYNNNKDSMYIKFLEDNHLYDFKNKTENRHTLYVSKILESDPMYDTFRLLNGEKAKTSNKDYDRIREELSLNLALHMPLKEEFKTKEDRDLKEAYHEAANINKE